MDIDSTIGEVKDTLSSFEKWTKPESAPFSLNFAAMRPVIRKEPKGLVLIISPFNYPIFLTIPLIVRSSLSCRLHLVCIFNLGICPCCR